MKSGRHSTDQPTASAYRLGRSKAKIRPSSAGCGAHLLSLKINRVHAVSAGPCAFVTAPRIATVAIMASNRASKVQFRPQAKQELHNGKLTLPRAQSHAATTRSTALSIAPAIVLPLCLCISSISSHFHLISPLPRSLFCGEAANIQSPVLHISLFRVIS